MKQNKILIFTLFFAFLGLLFCGLNVSATITTSSEISVQGAQVRTAGTAGIRFVGKVEESYVKTNVTAYGMALAFGEVNADEIEVGGTVNGKNVLSAQVSSLEGTNYYVNLTDIPNTMYGQKVTARAYVVDNGNIIYADAATVRSLGQVTLAVKAAGQTSTLIEEITKTLKSDYKNVYTDANGNIFVGNGVYEINPANLEKEFVKDWNAKFGTTWTEVTIDQMVSAAANGFSANTDVDPSLGDLFKFFRSEEYQDKWLWLIEFLSPLGAGTTHAKVQADAIINYDLETNTNSNTSSLWKNHHLAASISNFFNGLSENIGYTGVYFSDVNKYKDLENYNDQIYASDATLVKVGNSIELPEITPSAGYEFNDYILEDAISGTYTVTSSSVIIKPQYTAIEYSVKYYEDGKELTDLTDSTYTVENEYTLPVIGKDGYDFEGWYEDSSFSGSPITKIEKGTTGDKTYYAKFVVAEYADVNVTYDLNGGYFLYPTLEAAIEDFVNDFNTATSLSYTVEEYGLLGAWKEVSTTVNFLYMEAYNAKWTWLIDYLAEVGSDNNKTAFAVFNNYSSNSELQTHDNQDHYRIAYEIRGWVGQWAWDLNANFPATTNYGDADIQAKSLAAAKGQTSYVYKEACNLLTPKHETETFAGWKSSVDGEIVTEFPGFATNPGNITYTAQWGTNQEGVYSITYKDEAGNILTGLTPTSYTTEQGGSIDLPALIEKEGYECLGWFEDDVRVVTFFASDAEDKVFVIKYQVAEETQKFSIPSDMTFMITELTHFLHSSGNYYVYQPVMPSTAPSTTKTNYTWSSLNTDVVTISSYSTLSIASSGYAIIKAVYNSDTSKVGYAVLKVSGDTITISSIEEANTPVYYTVTFTDENGTPISTQTVQEGKTATLPTPPAKAGYTFYGWSGEHFAISSNITLEPTYIAGTSDFVGKTVSILGDSVSTYKGYVPDGYSCFYPYPTADLRDVNDTWWMQAINKLGMKLLKNNSYSGSCVSTGTGSSGTTNDARLAELLDGTTAPDIIIIFMGANDAGSSNVSLSTYTSSYKTMIEKIIALCPNSEIYLMILPPSNLYTDANRISYNNVIINYASQYSLTYLDMQNAYDGEDVASYLVDSAHQNKAGMTKLGAEVVEQLLKSVGIQ